jgi:hypothetical protein
MLSRFSSLLLVSLYLLTVQAALSRPQQPPAFDENGWTTLTAGQSLYGIRYEESGAIWIGDSQQKACTPGELYVSKPSPVKGVAVVICDNSPYDKKGYLVDTQSERLLYSIVSKSIIDVEAVLDKWVSWSPDEKFALLATAGEGFQGPMILVDLNTGTTKEIDYKRLGLKGETEILNQQTVSWLSGNSFRMRFDIYCQVFSDEPRCAYGRCKGDCDRGIHRSYWARVNLSPFIISYDNARQPSDGGSENLGRISAKPQTAIPQARNSAPLSKQELIRQIISDDNTVTSSCIEKLGGAESAVEVKSLDLNRDGKTDYLVSGRSADIYIDMTGSGKTEILDCVCGSRRCHEWLYVNTGDGYRLVLSVKDGGIMLLKTYTNGYRDLRVESVLGNSRPSNTIYKFDGTGYREVKQRTHIRR